MLSKKIFKIMFFSLLIIIMITLPLLELTGNIFNIDNNVKSLGSWTVTPFIVNDYGQGNYTWEEAVLEPWCSGNGTLEDPYVIENVVINATNENYGILIYNSSNNSSIIFISYPCCF